MEELKPDFVDIARENIQYSFSVKEDNDGNIVVGEIHVNPKGLSEEKRQEQTKLLEEQPEDTLFVVEYNTFKNKRYVQIGGVEDTLMGRTIQFAQEKDRNLIFMDDENGTEDDQWWKSNASWYALWQRMGSTISREDFFYMRTVVQIMDTLTRDPKGAEEYIQKALEYTMRNQELSVIEKSTLLNAIKGTITGLEQGGLKKMNEAVMTFINYDGRIRDRYYQEKIVNIKKANPGKKIFAVFGKNHQETILEALNNPNGSSNTQPQNEAKMLWTISELKEYSNAQKELSKEEIEEKAKE